MDNASRPRQDDGRYRKWPACDCCGKPVDVVDRHFTDDAVCGGGDGPGFNICGRVRCGKRIEKVDAGRGFDDLAAIEDRRDLFTRQDAENTVALSEGRRPKQVALK